jgi:hypothetical protein
MSVYQHNNQQVTYFRYIAYKPCQTFCTVHIINFWIYVWSKFAEMRAKCYRNWFIGQMQKAFASYTAKFVLIKKYTLPPRTTEVSYCLLL